MSGQLDRFNPADDRAGARGCVTPSGAWDVMGEADKLDGKALPEERGGGNSNSEGWGAMADLVEQLRRAMDDSGLTTYAIAKQSGANIDSLYRFRNGEADLTLSAAAKLAQALGLKLVGADGKEIKGARPKPQERPQATARATRKRATPKRPKK